MMTFKSHEGFSEVTSLKKKLMTARTPYDVLTPAQVKAYIQRNEHRSNRREDASWMSGRNELGFPILRRTYVHSRDYTGPNYKGNAPTAEDEYIEEILCSITQESYDKWLKDTKEAQLTNAEDRRNIDIPGLANAKSNNDK